MTIYQFITKQFSHPLQNIDYHLEIAIPKSQQNQPLPVIYVLDGNAYGKLFQEVINLQARRRSKTNIENTVIVSIGYASNELFPQERVFDFTPPSAKENTDKKPDGSDWPENGGSHLFLNFLQETIKPYVQSLVLINPLKQTLFGHSLGGLFSLYTLFTAPREFNHYFICSPSIWWHGKQILKLKRKNCEQPTHIVIAAEHHKQKAMHKNAKKLARKLKQKSNHKVLFLSPKHENHMSIVPNTMSAALRFIQPK